MALRLANQKVVLGTHVTKCKPNKETAVPGTQASAPDPTLALPDEPKSHQDLHTLRRQSQVWRPAKTGPVCSAMSGQYRKQVNTIYCTFSSTSMCAMLSCATFHDTVRWSVPLLLGRIRAWHDHQTRACSTRDDTHMPNWLTLQYLVCALVADVLKRALEERKH